ncbi:MAG: hypothetical protein PWQ53_469 [Bacteroidota bacterium]|nr:hypothetical protein [Methermicoccus sp.]MBZ4674849.1 hypothetical protein [Dysgonamonadaceae bacterium]MDN5296774.1 hypothetical protein [Bacteroidota bacterium]MDN5305810.1 hypothetical protein [Bacteroidota bacterium]
MHYPLHLCCIKRIKFIGNRVYPAINTGSGYLYSKFFETFGLSVFGEMVKKFIYDNLTEQRFSCNTSGQYHIPSRGLNDGSCKGHIRLVFLCI